jgi:hypothetical protein
MYKTGSWQNFAMTSTETSHTKKVANELSSPLVTDMTHFGIRFSRYGILMSYSSSEHVIDRLDCSCSVRFLGHKMGETCKGTNTQTHVSDNRSNGYGLLNTATCGVHRSLKFCYGRS